MDKTDLGNRMKSYEKRYLRKALPFTPLVCRIDGKCFHTFTKGLKRPYDERLSNLMINTTKYLVAETNANCGYTQSDEISLVWDSPLMFDGRIDKINSVLSSMTTAYFNKHLNEAIPEKSNKMPIFDCRTWELPEEEVPNYFIWREQDAVKNSISMAAQSVYSHKQLNKKNSSEKQDLLHKKGINWNDYPNFFKRGTYVRRRNVQRKFTLEEFENLPEKHHARKNPNLEIKRNVVMVENFEPLTKISNRKDVILKRIDPILESSLQN